MKLYKFRPLSSMERVLDIVLNQRLYCAPFEQLNDPFEGVFLAVHHVPPPAWGLKTPTKPKLTTVSTLRDADKVSRICSLSANFRDLRLWAHYADGHKSVAIEVDFSGIEHHAVPVEYVKKLPTYYPATVLGTPFPDQILSKKTFHWEYEDERRVLQPEVYYSVADRVTSVLLGARVHPEHRDLLKKALAGRVSFFTTNINENTLEVELGELDE